jgi:hypothetical protein
LADEAKMGVLLASILAAILGAVALVSVSPAPVEGSADDHKRENEWIESPDENPRSPTGPM